MTDTAGDTHFWSEAGSGRLVFQHCDECGFARWPVAGVCPECLSRAHTWRPVEPVGTVWSYVVYHRAYAAPLRAAVPYNVALVELDCGVRLLTRLTGFAPDADPVGTRVSASFTAVAADGGPVPGFGPV